MAKGYLCIQCENCGDTEQYKSLNSIESHVCRRCGYATPIPHEKLRPIYLECECGYDVIVRTNIDKKMFDVNCINRSCRQPITVELRKKSKNAHGYYVAINSYKRGGNK